MAKQITTTGRTAVCVSRYTDFDISAPQKTDAHRFVFLNPDAVNNGVLEETWLKNGYRFVGWADVAITFVGADEMLTSAVESLKAQKQKVIADAQAAATRIEGEIQKLLAISYSEVA